MNEALPRSTEAPWEDGLFWVRGLRDDGAWEIVNYRKSRIGDRHFFWRAEAIGTTERYCGSEVQRKGKESKLEWAGPLLPPGENPDG